MHLPWPPPAKNPTQKIGILFCLLFAFFTFQTQVSFSKDIENPTLDDEALFFEDLIVRATLDKYILSDSVILKKGLGRLFIPFEILMDEVLEQPYESEGELISGSIFQQDNYIEFDQENKTGRIWEINNGEVFDIETVEYQKYFYFDYDGVSIDINFLSTFLPVEFLFNQADMELKLKTDLVLPVHIKKRREELPDQKIQNQSATGKEYRKDYISNDRLARIGKINYSSQFSMNEEGSRTVNRFKTYGNLFFHDFKLNYENSDGMDDFKFSLSNSFEGHPIVSYYSIGETSLSAPDNLTQVSNGTGFQINNKTRRENFYVNETDYILNGTHTELYLNDMLQGYFINEGEDMEYEFEKIPVNRGRHQLKLKTYDLRGKVVETTKEILIDRFMENLHRLTYDYTYLKTEEDDDSVMATKLPDTVEKLSLTMGVSKFLMLHSERYKALWESSPELLTSQGFSFSPVYQFVFEAHDYESNLGGSGRQLKMGTRFSHINLNGVRKKFTDFKTYRSNIDYEEHEAEVIWRITNRNRLNFDYNMLNKNTSDPVKEYTLQWRSSFTTNLRSESRAGAIDTYPQNFLTYFSYKHTDVMPDKDELKAELEVMEYKEYKSKLTVKSYPKVSTPEAYKVEFQRIVNKNFDYYFSIELSDYDDSGAFGFKYKFPWVDFSCGLLRSQNNGTSANCNISGTLFTGDKKKYTVNHINSDGEKGGALIRILDLDGMPYLPPILLKLGNKRGTTENGEFIFKDLNPYLVNYLEVDQDTFPDFTLTLKNPRQSFTVLPGEMRIIEFQMEEAREIEGEILLLDQDDSEQSRGLINVPLILTDSKGETIKFISEFEGYFYKSSILKGEYTLSIDGEYLQRKNLIFKPITVDLTEESDLDIILNITRAE